MNDCGLESPHLVIRVTAPCQQVLLHDLKSVYLGVTVHYIVTL